MTPGGDAVEQEGVAGLQRATAEHHVDVGAGQAQPAEQGAGHRPPPRRRTRPGSARGHRHRRRPRPRRPAAPARAGRRGRSRRGAPRSRRPRGRAARRTPAWSRSAPWSGPAAVRWPHRGGQPRDADVVAAAASRRCSRPGRGTRRYGRTGATPDRVDAGPRDDGDAPRPRRAGPQHGQRVVADHRDRPRPAAVELPLGQAALCAAGRCWRGSRRLRHAWLPGSIPPRARASSTRVVRWSRHAARVVDRRDDAGSAYPGQQPPGQSRPRRRSWSCPRRRR